MIKLYDGGDKFIKEMKELNMFKVTLSETKYKVEDNNFLDFSEEDEFDIIEIIMKKFNSKSAQGTKKDDKITSVPQTESFFT